MMIRSCRFAVARMAHNLHRLPSSPLARQRPFLFDPTRPSLVVVGSRRQSVAWISSNSSHEDNSSSSNFESDPDNLASWDAIVNKLMNVFRVVSSKLGLQDNENTFKMLHSMMALIQLMKQLLERRDDDRNAYYAQSGRAGVAADLEGLEEGCDLANAAYETSTAVLKENLKHYGYHLLRHDTKVLPGALGHYIAMSKATKTVLVGVRGTSSLEEVLTDCCASSVQKVLGDGTSITCHEGIYISSKALADDLEAFVEELVIPSGYSK